MQIEKEAGEQEIVGRDITVREIEVVWVHPSADLPVSVYVCMAVGVAITIVPVELLTAVSGNQA